MVTSGWKNGENDRVPAVSRGAKTESDDPFFVFWSARLAARPKMYVFWTPYNTPGVVRSTVSFTVHAAICHQVGAAEPIIRKFEFVFSSAFVRFRNRQLPARTVDRPVGIRFYRGVSP